jgi:hypothetical protein
MLKKGDLAVVIGRLCEHDEHVGTVFTVDKFGTGAIGCKRCLTFHFNAEIIVLPCGCGVLKSNVKKIDGLTDEEKEQILNENKDAVRI